LDFGEDAKSGQSCIVMVRAERNLREYLISTKALPEQEAADILRQVAEGLVEAGDWIHRDLKPENVLQTNGQWQIADFGIARLADATTSARTLKDALTPPYAAPEQFDGRRATHATDVYSLGCIGFEMLSGKWPFPGPAHEDFAQQHRHELPILKNGSPLIRLLILRMLARPEVARPDIREAITELASSQLGQAGRGPAASRLAAASAVVAEETARQLAAAQGAAAKRKEREALASQALTELRGIADELLSRIKQNAPQARVVQGRPLPIVAFEIGLGQGTLAMSVGQFSDIPENAFHESKWDVVCGDVMVVKTAQYARSASLWYAKRGNGPYQWIEVAYWALNRDPSKQPCYLPPGEDADFAAAPIMHSWNLAYQPRPITGKDMESFLDRWIDFFASAVAMSRSVLNEVGVTARGWSCYATFR